VLARAAIARMAACKHTMSACKKHVFGLIYTFNSSLLTRVPLHLLLALVLNAPCRNFFDAFTSSIAGIFGTLGIAAVTTQRIQFFLELFDFRGGEYSTRRGL
jgi:hypothetical protein